MTGPPVFGDFASAARRELDAAEWASSGARGRDTEEVTRSLLRLAVVAGRYASDITAAFSAMHRLDRGRHRTWIRAADEAVATLSGAATALGSGGSGWPEPGEPPACELARRLDTTASLLTAGRDLLQTHFAQSRDGRALRSAWAPVIASPVVSRALLADITSVTALAAARAARLPELPWRGASATVDAAQRLSVGCQWLAQADAIAQAANQHEPVPTEDRDLLFAIPGSALPARPVPAGDQLVSGLCEAITDAAERLRRLSWAAGRLDPRSPAISVTSWRNSTAAGASASQHCSLLLVMLAARSTHFGSARSSAELADAGTAIRLTGRAWTQSAGWLAQITTDIRGRVSPAAAAAADLALLTGRLTYASSAWTPASGSGQPVRQPGDLAPFPRDIPHALAAVHHAADSLRELAAANDQQIRSAAAAQRVLIPVRSLDERVPDARDMFVPAPASRMRRLLWASSVVRTASASSADTLGEIAVAMHAPSRILLTARAATGDPRRGGRPRRAAPGAGAPHPARAQAEDREPGGPAAPAGQADLAGPFESRMREIGITSGRFLRRAAGIDRDGHKIVAEAARERLARASADWGAAGRPAGRAGARHAAGAGHEPEAEP